MWQLDSRNCGPISCGVRVGSWPSCAASLEQEWSKYEYEFVFVLLEVPSELGARGKEEGDGVRRRRHSQETVSGGGVTGGGVRHLWHGQSCKLLKKEGA